MAKDETPRQGVRLVWPGRREMPPEGLDDKGSSRQRGEPLDDCRLARKKSMDGGDGDPRNLLIQGDNLLAIELLMAEFGGRVKCVYMDPPYNTKNAFEHYEDSFEDADWLSFIHPRLLAIRGLLAEDGLFWASIGDEEHAYLKILCDEVFGRGNLVGDIAYERSGSAGLGQGGIFVNNSEHILVYKKANPAINDAKGKTPLELKTMKRYNKVLVSEGQKRLVREFKSVSNGLPVRVYEHEGFEVEKISLRNPEERMEEIMAAYVYNFPNIFRTNNVQKENSFQNDLMSKMEKSKLYTVTYTPSRGKREGMETTLHYLNAELFSWLKDSAELVDGKICKTNKLTTVWRHEDIPKADLANEGGVDFPRSKKPEQLLKRILEISTNEGDLVLDPFLGSGTTAAVAHKMGRRWIGIEDGPHVLTHCKRRLDLVVAGKEPSGVTREAGWKGGGGYRFMRVDRLDGRGRKNARKKG